MFFVHDCRNTILAHHKMLTMDTWKSKLNNNICLVGASGRGKTRGFIKPNIMQMNSSYVISDPKGTLVLELGNMLETHGYKVKVLNLLDMEHSNTYNPFNYIRTDDDVYKLIKYIMANVNPGYFLRGGDRFWDDAATTLLSAICFYLHHECRPEDRTFANVMKLMRCLEVREGFREYESTLDIMFRTLEELDPEHIAVKQYQVFKSGADKTEQSIQITAEVLLQYFNLDEYEMLTSSDNISLASVGTEKTALFVTVSDTDRSKNWLAGVFYCQLFDELCHYADTRTVDHRLPVHVRFILDDFVCTAKIPEFDYKMAMIRSREISCIVAIQDEAQLIKEYGLAAQGIIANCDSYVFLGSSNIDSCDIVAHRLGDPDITGADIRRMGYNECVLICGNEGGIFKKYNLKNHPRYPLISDGSTENRYDLYGKHRIARKPKEERYRRRSDTVTLKESLFDSREEEYLYSVLCQISNLYIYPHQQLRDIFQTDDKKFSIKLSFMHCDFVIRDDKDKVMFAIEVDGEQHTTDKDQLANDKIKDNFFAMNGIPLLRFTTFDVRNNVPSVITEIIKTAEKADNKEHKIELYPTSFDVWYMDQLERQKQERKLQEMQQSEKIQRLMEQRRESLRRKSAMNFDYGFSEPNDTTTEDSNT